MGDFGGRARGSLKSLLSVQVGDIAKGVANIIADPTTAGKVYEFVG